MSQFSTQTGSTNTTSKTHGSSATIKRQNVDDSNRSRRSDMSGLSASDNHDRQGDAPPRHGSSSSSRRAPNSDNHETSSRRSRQGSTSSSRRSHHSTSSRRSGDSRCSPPRRSNGSDRMSSKRSNRGSGTSRYSNVESTKSQDDHESIYSMDSGQRKESTRPNRSVRRSSFGRSEYSNHSPYPESDFATAEYPGGESPGPGTHQHRRASFNGNSGHNESLQNLALNDSLREAYMGSRAVSELPVTRRMSNSSEEISPYPVIKGTAVAIVGDDQANEKPKRAKKLFKMLSLDTMESNDKSSGLSRRTIFGRRNNSSHRFNQSDGNIFANDFDDSFASSVVGALDRSVSSAVRKMSFGRRRSSVDHRRSSDQRRSFSDNPVDTSIASFRSLPNDSRQSFIAQQQAVLKMKQESLAREIDAFNALLNPHASGEDSFAGNATFQKSSSDVGRQEVSQSSHGRSADTITSLPLLEPTQLPHTSPAVRRYKAQTIGNRNEALADRRASFDENNSYGGNPSSESLKNSTTSSSESFHRRSSTTISTSRTSFQRSSIGSHTYRSSIGTRSTRGSSIRTKRSLASNPSYGSHPGHRSHRSSGGSVASVGSTRSDPYQRSRSRGEFSTSPRVDSVPGGSRRSNQGGMSRSPHSPRGVFVNHPPPQHRNTRRDAHAGTGFSWGDLDDTIQSAIQNSVQDLSTSVYTKQAWIPVAVEVNHDDDDTQGDDTLSAACSHSQAASSRSAAAWRCRHCSFMNDVGTYLSCTSCSKPRT